MKHQDLDQELGREAVGYELWQDETPPLVRRALEDPAWDVEVDHALKLVRISPVGRSLPERFAHAVVRSNLVLALAVLASIGAISYAIGLALGISPLLVGIAAGGVVAVALSRLGRCATRTGWWSCEKASA